MKATFFPTPADFRRWLKTHHKTVRELWVGFHKKATGRPSISWPESVDEALCFGWIDGVRRTIDGESYMIRFTPRRPGSIWSHVNTRRATALIRLGRMQPAGLAAFKKRDAKKTGVYSFEREHARLSEDAEARFRKNRAAWRFFEAQPPGYQRLAIFYVTSARQAATQARRLDRLIQECAAGRRLGPKRSTP